MSHAHADTPRPHRLTVADYYRMAEVGILAPDARVELIDGEIIDMVPPGSSHAAAVDRLTKILVTAVGDGAIVRIQNPVRLGAYSAPQPDVALLRYRDDFYDERLPQAADVLLVVEIAVTSLRFDQHTKGDLYAAHEIPEFWLVDVSGKRLVRQRAPREGAYTLVDEPNLAAALEVSILPGVTIDLRRLFG
jgi:Uma2 family endonuclease